MLNNTHFVHLEWDRIDGVKFDMVHFLFSKVNCCAPFGEGACWRKKNAHPPHWRGRAPNPVLPPQFTGSSRCQPFQVRRRNPLILNPCNGRTHPYLLGKTFRRGCSCVYSHAACLTPFTNRRLSDGARRRVRPAFLHDTISLSTHFVRSKNSCMKLEQIYFNFPGCQLGQ